MARGSLRRRFLVGSIASTLLAVAIFAVGSAAIVVIHEEDFENRDDGDTFRDEAFELILMGMGVAGPLAMVAAIVTAVVLSRRTAQPIADAIAAARETTAHDLQRRLPVPERDDELRDLVLSLNELFARLDEGFGALARFAADASHELRTPLAVMATELEVALRHPRQVQEWEASGRTSLGELRRLTSLVEGLLTLARAGADSPTEHAPLRLVECVDAVVAQLAATAEHSQVTLSGPLEELPDFVEGNPVMLETAIRNLVENAISATPPGGQVRVSFEPSPQELTVVVDDDGPGLGGDPEALFLPFRRGELRADRAARGVGVGLGLTIARRVALSHGGRLAGARSPMGGARFLLTLPRSPRAAA